VKKKRVLENVRKALVAVAHAGQHQEAADQLQAAKGLRLMLN
jgi:hypothetical protein